MNYHLFSGDNKLATFALFKDLSLIDLTTIKEYKKNVFIFLFIFIVLLGLILYIINYYIYSEEIRRLYNDVNKNKLELEKINESLQDLVNEEIRKNDKKNKILFQQNKLAARGEMIGNIAHQWRQPLSVITASASALKIEKELGITKKDEELKSLNVIINSAQYLSNTIDDFRCFFLPNKQKNTFNMINLIEKIMNLVEKEYELKNIKIIKNLKSIDIQNYENELQQVVLNLLNNSKDELITKDKFFKKYIFIDIQKKDKMLIIKVKDNAGGIDKNIIERVFEPYFTTKYKSQGTGIGLYMSEEIITKHMNGVISVKNVSYEYENKDYVGACFKIEMPI
jgi:signal transduction histidine kinase